MNVDEPISSVAVARGVFKGVGRIVEILRQPPTADAPSLHEVDMVAFSGTLSF